MIYWKQLLDTIINQPLRKVGYEICRYADSPSLEAALARTVAKTRPVHTVIDVGASDGRWSSRARRFYPEAHYFLIEANCVHEEKLRTFCDKFGKADYVLAAAGDVVGEVYFDDSDPLGGQAAHVAQERHGATVAATTVDYEVTNRQLQGPFLLKLDTHGFEVPIFEGAKETLRNTNLIVVETYNFQTAPDSLRFHQMCSYLEGYGFRPVDLCGLLHRPSDKSLWQFDLFFVPATRQEFTTNSYS